MNCAKVISACQGGPRREREEELVADGEGNRSNAEAQPCYQEPLEKSREKLTTYRQDPKSQRVRQWEEERAKSVFIHGLQEREERTHTERQQEERKEIEKIITEIGEEMDEIVNFQRIGGYSKGRNRPIKLILRTETVRNRILQEKPRLKYSEEYKRVFLDRDRTQSERQQLRERTKKRKELGKETRMEPAEVSQSRTEQQGQAHTQLFSEPYNLSHHPNTHYNPYPQPPPNTEL
ncbi:hypothetical protein OTU49_014055 [Cherax quadricarinatus]|uniref:Uncharacterized protein n=1 Tax=Cherax quadricarinatus TaxID=27406 RepID=A0AAW0VR49_CHEQU